MVTKLIEGNNVYFSFNEKNTLLHMSFFYFDQVSLPFEKALWEYVQEQEKEFSFELNSLPKKTKLHEPNFLNLKFEELFDILVDTTHQDPNQVLQIERETNVTSQELVIHIQLSNVNSAESLSNISPPPFSFNIPVVPPPPEDKVQLPPPVSSSQSTLPSVPTITIDSAFTGGMNTEVLLNTQSSLQFGGNIFNLGVSAGAINVFFTPPARPGSTENRTIPDEIFLTTPEGNTLTLYTTDVSGHLAGDFIYVLNHVILTPPQPFIVIGSNRVFVDQFSYSATNAEGLTNLGKLDVEIIDDAPVATNQSAPGTLAEANIPVIGSNPGAVASTLTGSLIVPSSPGNLSDNRIGANGGTVSNVTVAGGTTLVSSTTVFVQDVQTNMLVVDRTTGDYTYTLNGPFHNTNNQPYNEIFIYTFKDNEGQTSNANLTVTILDDAPIAKPITATSVYESALANGTNPGANPTTATGNIIGTNGNLFGADNGTVTNVTIVGGTTTVSAGVVTAKDSVGNALVVNPNGSYTYTLSHAVTNVNNQPLDEVFTFTLTDGDGSTSNSTLTIAINDDAPIAAAITASSVYEAGLASGSNPGGKPITSSGNIIGTNGNTFGADGGTVTNVTMAGATTVINAGVVTVTDSVGNTLAVNANGSYTYTLNHNVTNVNNQPLDEVFTFTLTDGDGSTSNSTLTIAINDDAPIAAVITASSVYEAGLASGSNPGGKPITSSGNIIGTNGNTFGADGGTVTNVTMAGATTVINAGVITVTDSVGNTLAVNANGSYTYTLNHNVTNVNNQPLDEAFTFTLTDGDGSVSSSTLTIAINDDAPIAKPITATSVYESALPSGTNPGANPLTATGNIIGTNGNTFGADGGTVTNVTIVGGSTTINAGVITATDSVGNTLVVNANGSYTYTLSHAVTNVNNQPLDEVFTFTLTDGDGSTSNSTLTIAINDDAPIAAAITASSVYEAGLASGSNPGGKPITSSGNIIGTNGNTFGADGGTVTNVTMAGATTVINAGVVTVTDSVGNTLAVNANGSYTYTLNHNVTNVNNQPLDEVFTFTLTDGDGSTSNSTLTIAINDDAPIAAVITASSVYEAGLASGSNPGGKPITSSGNIIGTNGNTFGADGGTVTNVTMAGATTVINAGVITVTDSVGNTLAVNANGSYTYTLNHNVTNVNNQPLDEAFTFTLTDGDGSVSSSTLTIAINDDAPIAKPITATSVYESALPSGTNPGANPLTATGNIIGTNGNTFGADGGTVTNVTIVGGSTTINAGVITATDSVGNALVVNPNGSYTYTLNHNVSNVNSQPLSEAFNFTLTDSDGSTSNSTLTVNIVDDIPIAASVITISVYESALPSGTNPGANPLTATGNIIGTNGNTFGADGGTVTNVTVVGGSTTINAGVITATDSVGNTLVVNANGGYTYTLNHAVTNVNNQPLDEVFTFTLTDGDGSTSNSTLTVAINDDAPIAMPVTATSVFESGLANGTNPGANPTTATGNIIGTNGNTFGADGGTVTNVTIAGGSTTINAGVVTATDSVGNTLVVNANGSYTYTLNHAVTNVNNQPLDEVFTFTLTDADGSTSNSTLMIAINDDAPNAAAITASSVYEAGLPGGSNPGGQPTTSSGNIIGTNGNIFGADNGTVTNATLAGGTTTIASGVITVTDSVGNTMVIQPSGSYLYTLTNPVASVNHQPFDEVFTFTLTDDDGSTSNSTLTIAINDDAPNAQPVTASSVFESGLATGTNPGGEPITSTGNIIGSNGNSFGIHGGTVTNVTSTAGATVNSGGTFTTTDSVGNTMVIHPNGSYTFTLNSHVTNVNSQPLNEIFNFTLTDTTGSISSSTLTLGINDDIPIATAVSAGSVFESALSSGTNPGGNTLTVTGTINSANGNKFGADGGTITNVTIPGGTTTSSSGVFTAKDSVGNALTLTASTGFYSFTLSHAVTNSGSQPLKEAFTFILTDGDGSTSSNTLTVSINDDLPVANPTTVSGPPAIGDSISGNFFTITGNKPGADGLADVVVIPFNGSSSTVGNVTTFTDPWGNTLAVNTVTGAYTFTWHANIPGNLTSYNYLLFDKDGSGSAEEFLKITGLPPIVLDLTGNGIHLLSPEQSSRTFDSIFHNGDQRKLGWIAEGEGLLMLNTNHDGSLTHVDQIAFISYLPGAKTDLEGLTAFDTNHDNKLDAQDNDFAQFGVLLADNSFRTLSELGIASISLVSNHQQEISNENIIFGFSNYETLLGEKYTVADVQFKIDKKTKSTVLNPDDILPVSVDFLVNALENTAQTSSIAQEINVISQPSLPITDHFSVVAQSLSIPYQSQPEICYG